MTTVIRHYNRIYFIGTAARGQWSDDGAYGEAPLTQVDVEACLNDAEGMLAACNEMEMTTGCTFELWEKRVKGYRLTLAHWPIEVVDWAALGYNDPFAD